MCLFRGIIIQKLSNIWRVLSQNGLISLYVKEYCWSYDQKYYKFSYHFLYKLTKMELTRFAMKLFIYTYTRDKDLNRCRWPHLKKKQTVIIGTRCNFVHVRQLNLFGMSALQAHNCKHPNLQNNNNCCFHSTFYSRTHYNYGYIGEGPFMLLHLRCVSRDTFIRSLMALYNYSGNWQTVSHTHFKSHYTHFKLFISIKEK